MQRCKSLLDKHVAASRRFRVNAPMLMRVALRLLRNSGLTVRQSDKDGCFTLVQREGLLKAMANAMPLTKYEPMPLYAINVYNIKDQYGRLVKNILAALGRPELRSVVYFGVRVSTTADLALPVVVNIKTHKQIGDMGCRTIHGSSKYVS